MTGLWDSPSVPDPAAGPRGRGNPNADMSEPYYWRSIPAWAGEPRINPRLGRWRGVYPRVGGGTLRYLSVPTFSQGLSPRGRGNPTNSEGSDDWTGSIPAWAGEPGKARPFSPMGWVYPRVGGGTATWKHGSRPPNGLSPRGRGNPQLRRLHFNHLRSIPAWAGELRRCWASSRPIEVYPRVGGGTRLPHLRPIRQIGLSPRGRGNLFSGCNQHVWRRSIPAWAGEPSSLRLQPRPRAVYPRVGGGTATARNPPSPNIGLSPRGRGNLGMGAGDLKNPGSIPAWAGEPPHRHSRRSGTSVYPRVGGGTSA